MMRPVPLALLAIVLAAPLLGGVLDALVHAACAPLCHQDASRSFALFGHALPLCARCTGVLVGIALGALYFGSPALGDRRAWPLLVALGAMDRLVRPLAIDHPVERLALGAALGLGIVLAVSMLPRALRHGQHALMRAARVRI